MEYDIPDEGFDCIATLDIETTHWKPRQGEVVSVGVGVHKRGEPADTADYELLHRTDSSVENETELIKQSFGALNATDADVLVSYKGKSFDLDFLNSRLRLSGEGQFHSDGLVPNVHVDLFALRKQRCDRTGEKWPSLEECLASYGFPVPETTWNGEPLDNVRFGEELGPAYLRALDNGDVGELSPVIEHYLQTDLEANFAIYYSDIGVGFEPAVIDSDEVF